MQLLRTCSASNKQLQLVGKLRTNIYLAYYKCKGEQSRMSEHAEGDVNVCEYELVNMNSFIRSCIGTLRVPIPYLFPL